MKMATTLKKLLHCGKKHLPIHDTNIIQTWSPPNICMEPNIKYFAVTLNWHFNWDKKIDVNVIYRNKKLEVIPLYDLSPYVKKMDKASQSYCPVSGHLIYYLHYFPYSPYLKKKKKSTPRIRIGLWQHKIVSLTVDIKIT